MKGVSFAVVSNGYYIREFGSTVSLGPCPELDGSIFTGESLRIAEGILSKELFDKIPLYINKPAFRPLCLKVLSEK